MITVIKPGKLSHTVTCTNHECMCKFSFQDRDIIHFNNLNMVTCPECKTKVRVIKCVVDETTQQEASEALDRIFNFLMDNNRNNPYIGVGQATTDYNTVKNYLEK